MTEQQIKALSRTLKESASNIDTNTPALDGKILNAAQLKATESPGTDGTPSSAFGLAYANFVKPLFAANNLSSATFSVVFTVIVFITLAKMVEVDDAGLPTLSAEALSSSTIETPSDAPKTSTDGVPSSISKPLAPIQEPVRSFGNNDSILITMPLPSVEQIIDDMNFEIAADRSLVKNALAVAMVDINQMIQQGNLNDASRRYERLRQSCRICELPDSLEVLALSTKGTPNTI